MSLQIECIDPLRPFRLIAFMPDRGMISELEEPVLNERSLLTILAAMQFTNIMDFMVMMPLGPQFKTVFQIDDGKFGLLVSSYAFSAGFFGLFGAIFIDRYDRRRSLLVLFAGFTIGTLLCGLSPDYHFLLLARTVTGAFGGIMGATLLALIGDVIPEERRGRAVGSVMAAFSVASIAGVPLGLLLADAFRWQATFYFIFILCVLIFISSLKFIPSAKGHLRKEVSGGGLKDLQRDLKRLFAVMFLPNHIRAFLFMLSMIMAGFSVIPYLANYMVANVGMDMSDLKYIYLSGGAFTFFTARIIGFLSDKFGKLRMFTIIAFLSMFPILLITNLPKLPFALVITSTTIFMIFVSGRFVPAMAMITSSARPEDRGSFMSLNSAVQQMASGIAAFVSGSIIGTLPDHTMVRYELVGLMALWFTVIAMMLASRLRLAESKGY